MGISVPEGTIEEQAEHNIEELKSYAMEKLFSGSPNIDVLQTLQYYANTIIQTKKETLFPGMFAQPILLGSLKWRNAMRNRTGHKIVASWIIIGMLVASLPAQTYAEEPAEDKCVIVNEDSTGTETEDTGTEDTENGSTETPSEAAAESVEPEAKTDKNPEESAEESREEVFLEEPCEETGTNESAQSDISIVGSGSCGADENNLTWTLDSEGKLTISGSGKMRDCSIPRESPFAEREEIKEVVVEDGVENIGETMFYGCSGIKKVTLPDTLISIGRYAFEGCSRLTDVDIPDGVVSIGDEAFYRCSSITGIDIPDGVTSIGAKAFYGCSSLVGKVIVPANIKVIELQTFRMCSSLTEVTLPDGLTKICDGAFEGCSSMPSITLPDSVTEIGSYAFANCNFSSFVIPDAVSYISGYTFNETRIKSIVIPESVTTIDMFAFLDATIQDVYYKGSEEQWANIKIYSYNYSLEDANIHYNYKPFEGSWTLELDDSYTAFLNESAQITAVFKGADDPSGRNIEWTCNDENVTLSGLSILGPMSGDSGTEWYASVSAAAAQAGKYTVYLTVDGIIMGSCTVTFIDAIGQCGDNVYWKIDEDNVLTIIGTGSMWDYDIYHPSPWNSSKEYDPSTMEPWSIVPDYTVEKVIIEHGVTSIGNYAFNNCVSMRTAIIPYSVKRIGEYALYYCNSLYDVYYAGFAEDWEAITIADQNDQLTGTTLHCSYKDEMTTWPLEGQEYYFFELKDPSKLITTVYKGDDDLSKRKIEWVCENGSIPITDTSILSGSDSEGSAIWQLSAVVGGTVAENGSIRINIDDTASLRFEVCIRDADGRCGENAFWKLDENNVLTIFGTGDMQDYGEEDTAPWFSSSKLIKEIVIEEGITSVGNWSFHSCRNAENISLPYSLRRIGERAFNGCAAIRVLKLPDTIEYIGDFAFYQCAFLTHVFYRGNREKYSSLMRTGNNDTVKDENVKIHYNASDLSDVPMKDWWGISNMEATKDHHIDDRVWESVLSPIVYNELSEFQKGDANTQNGLCAGLAVSAMLFDQGIIQSEEFNASRVYDIGYNDRNSAIDMTAKELIKVTFVLPLLPKVDAQLWKKSANYGNYKGLYSAVKNYEQTGKDPVLFAFTGTGGHALWAYAMEEEEDYCDIYLYNCNYPDMPCIVRLNGSYPKFSGFKYIAPGISSFTELTYAICEEDAELAVAMYHKISPSKPLYSLREQGYVLVVVDGVSYLKDTKGKLIDIRTINQEDGTGSSSEGNEVKEAYYLRNEDLLALANETKEARTVSITDDVASVKIELPPGAQLEEQDLKADVNLPSGSQLSGSYTSIIGEKTVDVSFHSNAAESMNIDFSGENLSVTGESNLEITGEYDGMTVTANVEIADGKTAVIESRQEEDDVVLHIKTGDGEQTSLVFEPEAPARPVDIHNTEITLPDTSYTYSGSAKEPAVTVTYNGKPLIRDTDYKLSYSNNINVGTAIVTVQGIGRYTGIATKSFMILPGKTTRGDMFNLANNVKVTWKEVPGAKYYKVYRFGVKDPVIVTTGLVGWDKQPGLVNGKKYTYKIVASLTGKGDPSGDSPLSYSKVMYRLKTVVIRSVKNTAPGKVTVKYDKTTSGDSYVLQYCERQDMVGAKTKVVLGANNTSYTIGGLKKGKTYYISIRVRKKVNGIDYYTTFGVPKKITLTK